MRIRNRFVKPKLLAFNREEFLRSIESIDSKSHPIVSFDFFDTLVFRKSNTHYAGWRDISIGFFCNRITAEILARIIGRFKGYPEVNMKDIYRFMFTRWDPQIEIQYETNNLRPNPILRQIYNDLVSKGITVIVVSDTHFEKTLLASWLESFEFFSSDIYTSQEYLLTKSTGLFDLIHATCKFEYKRWVHIGDNPYSDITAPQKLGITALFYPKLMDQLKDLQLLSVRGTKKLSKFGRLEFGVSTHLRELLCNEKYPDWNQDDLTFWYVGFLVGAPVSRSISEKIHSDYLQEQFNLILYSSRDGYLPFISHSLSYPLDPVKYFKTSREISMNANFPAYVAQLIDNSKKVAVFDLGWRGSTFNSLVREFPHVTWYGYFWILRNPHLLKLAITQMAQRNKMNFWRSRDFLEIIFTDPSNGYGTLNGNLEPVQRANQVGDTARRLMLIGSESGIRTNMPPMNLSEATFLLSLITLFPSKNLLSLFESERHQIRNTKGNYLVTNSWSRLFSSNRVMWPPSAHLKRSYIGFDSVVFKLLVLLKESAQRGLNLFNRIRNLIVKQVEQR